jgi:hypothetical protein
VSLIFLSIIGLLDQGRVWFLGFALEALNDHVETANSAREFMMSAACLSGILIRRPCQLCYFHEVANRESERHSAIHIDEAGGLEEYGVADVEVYYELCNRK